VLQLRDCQNRQLTGYEALCHCDTDRADVGKVLPQSVSITLRSHINDDTIFDDRYGILRCAEFATIMAFVG